MVAGEHSTVAGDNRRWHCNADGCLAAIVDSPGDFLFHRSGSGGSRRIRRDFAQSGLDRFGRRR
jgi:hypothetical protein